jgi:hypothetical protein
LFGGVEVKIKAGSREPHLETVSKAVSVINMLKSASVEVLLVEIECRTYDNIWIKFPNRTELLVRSNETDRQKDYSNLIGFGSEIGCNKKATQLASDILKDIKYNVDEPKIGVKERKGYVPFDYINSMDTMRTLLDLVTSLNLAAEVIEFDKNEMDRLDKLSLDELIYQL